MNPPSLSHDQITERARKIWEDSGRPEGRDDEIWLEAERQLSSSGAPTPKMASLSGVNSGAPALFGKPAKPAEPIIIAEPTKMATPASFANRVISETASESAIENLISPPLPVQEAVKAALPAKDKMAAKPLAKPEVAKPEIKKPAAKKPGKS